MKSHLPGAALSFIMVTILLSACSQEPGPPSHAPRAANELFADDIPVAHTPPDGYGNSFPPPVLADCTEPLVAGAPDLRGIWKAIRVERDGELMPRDDRQEVSTDFQTFKEHVWLRL